MSISRINILFAIYSLSAAALLSGCLGTPVIYPHTSGHTGALRVTEIMDWKSGPELPEIYCQALRESGIVNVATKVREKNAGKELPRWGSAGDRTNRSCRWIPENPNLWARIL